MGRSLLALVALCGVFTVPMRVFAADAPPPPTQNSQLSPFAIRGIKGLWWDGLDNYRKALPWAARHRLNFLMLCYSSFPESGKDWRAPYTAEETAGFAELARQADQLGIELCLSINPGIWSKPPLVYSGDDDYERLWRKLRNVHHDCGIHSFALCLDDIHTELTPADQKQFASLGDAHVHLLNRLWNDLKALHPRPRLIFCPSAYTTRDAERFAEYTRTIGERIDPEVMMFWTGPVVCSPSITAADARHIAALLKRKPIVWDNYPVNDMFPWRPLLAPLKGRAPDLAGEVAGYMANPMKQWEASKIPLGTTARYLNEPANYDARRALDQVIGEYAAEDRDAVRRLIDCYGATFLGEPRYPPKPASDAARSLASELSARPNLRALWDDVRPTVEADAK